MTLQVITGPMFSGKSEELLRLLRRHEIAGKRVALLKPQIDTRYHETDVVSHNGLTLPGKSVSHPTSVHNDTYDVLGIDEVQFFTKDTGSWLPAIELFARAYGKTIIAAGLDMDFRGIPFDVTRDLAAVATDVVKLKAICTNDLAGLTCGNDAPYTQRIIDGTPVTHGEQVLVGGIETYEARCERCFVKE